MKLIACAIAAWAIAAPAAAQQFTMKLSSPTINDVTQEWMKAFKTGVEPLITFAHGPLMLLAHRPIRGVADFKGQKLRVPGGAPMHIEPFKKLGASPVSIPLGEVMPAMQNHTIDGFIGGLTVFTSFKYYDVAKGLTRLPGSHLIAAGLVNRNFMKSLGPDLERIVREEARKAEPLFSSWGAEDVERGKKLWAQNGGENIEMPPAEASRYLAETTGVLPALLAAGPQLREDYEALVAAARRTLQ